jgi:hypothetical protein
MGLRVLNASQAQLEDSDNQRGEFDLAMGQPMRASIDPGSNAVTLYELGAPSSVGAVSGDGAGHRLPTSMDSEEKHLQLAVVEAMNTDHHPLNFKLSCSASADVNAATAVAPVDDRDGTSDVKAV